MKQIYYELDCSALMCYFEVRINDPQLVLVFNEYLLKFIEKR
jgi:hypothetical protein